jgi:hypothetical protein
MLLTCVVDEIEVPLAMSWHDATAEEIGEDVLNGRPLCAQGRTVYWTESRGGRLLITAKKQAERDKKDAVSKARIDFCLMLGALSVLF